MKIKAFHKEIEIDENNKGINHYLNCVSPVLDEVSIHYWYTLRQRTNNKSFTDEQGAEDLRRMTCKELKDCVLANIEAALKHYSYLGGDYSTYVRKNSCK